MFSEYRRARFLGCFVLMYSKDYSDVSGRQPVCPENRARLDVSWICKMLPAGTLDILIRTLTEIQSRLEYLASSALEIEVDWPVITADVGSLKLSIQGQIVRSKKNDVALAGVKILRHTFHKTSL
jgi:hypothetical protein